MNHDAVVVERQNTIGLITVVQRNSRNCLSHDQCNYRVPGQPCRSISVYSGGTGKKDGRGLFAAAIGLALRIDDSDDWPFGRVLILLHRFTDTCGKRIALL